MVSWNLKWNRKNSCYSSHHHHSKCAATIPIGINKDSSMPDACHTWTQLNDLALVVVVAQWIERPPGVREVMGSLPVGGSGFFFAPRTCPVDQFTFHIPTAITRWMGYWRWRCMSDHSPPPHPPQSWLRGDGTWWVIGRVLYFGTGHFCFCCCHCCCFLA